MRAIKRTSRFKRDYRRELSGVLGKKLESLLRPVVEFLGTTSRFPNDMSIMPFPVSGKTTEIAISALIWR